MNVGPPEILVILIVALLVFGPKRLPEVGRQVGSTVRELRRMQDAVKGELDMVLHPEHGSHFGDSPEPGDHAALPYEEVKTEFTPYDESSTNGFAADGHHAVDFTPSDYVPPPDPSPDDLSAPNAEEERRFLGPPGSFS